MRLHRHHKQTPAKLLGAQAYHRSFAGNPQGIFTEVQLRCEKCNAPFSIQLVGEWGADMLLAIWKAPSGYNIVSERNNYED